MNRRDVFDWLAERRSASGLQIQRIAFRDCERWHWQDGALRHQSGRFFSIVGTVVRSGPPHLAGWIQPLIDQPEVGLLGLVVRRDERGWQWLMQAKTEPGNAGGTQLAPTVQATQSNYLCVHGGRPTCMLECFMNGRGTRRTITDIEQSEQGDRFLGKYNRNVVVEVAAEFSAPASPSWRWCSAEELRRALWADYSLNTDARSVLVCTDWDLLADGDRAEAFARWRPGEGFGYALQESYRHPESAIECEQALAHLDRQRLADPVVLQRVDLAALPGWILDDQQLAADDPALDPRVLAYSIATCDREVPQWCQPLLSNQQVGRIVLMCCRLGGVLRFFLSIGQEPGLRDGPQWAPSWISGRGHPHPEGILQALSNPNARLHASVWQSDEGGRFINALHCYQIVEVDARVLPNLDAHGSWLSLAALRRLALIRGVLTNELRSALSLLLHWA